MTKPVHLSAIIPNELAGKRLDQALAILFSQHSRSRLQNWIRNGDVHINNTVMRQRERVKGGELVQIKTTYEVQQSWSAEDISLQIFYEDEALLVLNKAAGMVVHPGAGNPEHTLLNALLHYDPKLEFVPRAGIVQRLDKDTSGLMVIARTPQCHTNLVEQLQARKIRREYQAIVAGVMTAGGSIDQPIGRHPRKRTHMAVVNNGKPAVTHYRIIKKYAAHTHVRVLLETGRTHQIRVHMSYLRHPIVGDPVYGRRTIIPKGASERLISVLQSFSRQALHAGAISLQHPITNELLHCEVPLPQDMQTLIDALEADVRKNR
ncbi:MAG: 23S rRNA pseudouridine(1911/1915/1917) synthase RluD [Gammaproteobacteria bacterium]|nr:23S rRNA pseudouridine(1911/1915/1917) synthase RluD [Gammaproteobacteria bacterium]